MKFLIAVFLILGIPSITITGFSSVAIAQDRVSKKLAIEFLEASQYKQMISASNAKERFSLSVSLNKGLGCNSEQSRNKSDFSINLS
jgi:hypothetical protein